MADPTIRVKQTLDNTQFKKGLKDSHSAAGKLAGQMKALGGVIAGAFAVGAIVSFTKAAFEGLDKQQKAEAKLTTALKGRVEVQKRLVEDAQRLQGQTLFGDETTIEAYAQLAAFIKNEEALKRLMPLVQDMATAMNMDLTQAAMLVGKSIGSGTNALKRYGIEITGAVGSSERLDSALASLNDKFQGQAEAATNTTLGRVQQLNNAWGDMTETLANFLAPALTKVAKGLTDVTKGADNFLSDRTLTAWQKFRVFLAGAVGDVETATKISTGAIIDSIEEQRYALEPARSGYEEFLGIQEEVIAKQKAEAEAATEAAKAINEQAKAVRKLDEESMKRITGGMKPITTGEMMGSGALTGQQEQILGALQQVSGSRISGMQLATEDVKELKMELKDLPESYSKTVDAMVESSQRLQSAFEAMGAAVGQALGEFIKGEAKFSDVAASLIQEIIKIVAGYLTESVAASFAGGASSGGPAAPFTGAAAAAAAISLFGSLVPALMASGGVVPGGYPGDTYPALLSSGEMVIPPHKLESVMGRGQQTVNVVGVIRGQDIHLINEKQTSKLSRYR